MGLDIAAYSNLEYVGHIDLGDEPEYPSAEYDAWERQYEIHHQAYAYKEFAHALMGVPDVRSGPEKWSADTFITGGYFKNTDQTESHGFRAGSYGGYNWWRSDMREKYNPDLRPEGPFYELINFADNEGTLCELACITLLVDFHTHREAHRMSWLGREHGEHQVQLYDDWTRAFELGAQRGLVDFR